jgi:hypothetical protein
MNYLNSDIHSLHAAPTERAKITATILAIKGHPSGVKNTINEKLGFGEKNNFHF